MDKNIIKQTSLTIIKSDTISYAILLYKKGNLVGPMFVCVYKLGMALTPSRLDQGFCKVPTLNKKFLIKFNKSGIFQKITK